MNLENLFIYFAPIIVIHSLLVFIQAFWKGRSQYDDIFSVEINGLSERISVQDLLCVQLNSRFCCNNLLICALVWSRRLRIVAYIPALLYLFAIILLLARDIFIVDFDTRMLAVVMVVFAFVLQVGYVFLKIYSKIPDILIDLHGNYRASSPLLILFDIVPIWRK